MSGGPKLDIELKGQRVIMLIDFESIYAAIAFYDHAVDCLKLGGLKIDLSTFSDEEIRP